MSDATKIDRRWPSDRARDRSRLLSPPESTAGAYYPPRAPRAVDVATGSGEFLLAANPPYAGMPVGWQCPACGAVMAPWQPTCTGWHVRAVSATGTG